MLDLIQVDSVADLREAQESGSLLSCESARQVSDEVALTLTAVNILRYFFMEMHHLWSLLQTKAILAVMKASKGLSLAEIEEEITKIKPMFTLEPAL